MGKSKSLSGIEESALQFPLHQGSADAAGELSPGYSMCGRLQAGQSCILGLPKYQLLHQQHLTRQPGPVTHRHDKCKTNSRSCPAARREWVQQKVLTGLTYAQTDACHHDQKSCAAESSSKLYGCMMNAEPMRSARPFVGSLALFCRYVDAVNTCMRSRSRPLLTPLWRRDNGARHRQTRLTHVQHSREQPSDRFAPSDRVRAALRQGPHRILAAALAWCAAAALRRTCIRPPHACMGQAAHIEVVRAVAY